jgi:DNA-binding transcriptional LysR family regulator
VDIDQLRTFLSIARSASFSRAASVLRRSQPAISRRIDLLEQELGAPLFERARSGALLTDAGAALLPYAESALAAVKDGEAAVRARLDGRTGTLSLAIVGTLANASFSRALRQFTRRFRDVRMALQTANSAEVSDLVRRGDATLGLRYLDDPSPGLVCRTVTEEQMVIVAGASHRLADGRPHRAKDLAGERWVAFPARRARESFVRYLDRKLTAAGLEERQVVPIDSLTAQKRLVEAGFGIALLAESGAEEELRLGTLKRLDIRGFSASIPVTLIHRRDGYLSSAAQYLISTIAASSA